MITGRVTTKGQVTLPKQIRERLHIQAGDTLAYDVESDGVLRVRKMEPFDREWHQALSATLAEEWNSPEDEEAFRDL
jgi:AbrB family looped-hinge helix DNA binding protein